MNVFWLEQREADVPEKNNWLSPREIVILNALRFVKRRQSWRLGRWTVKRALADCLNFPVLSSALARIEVVPAPSGAPELIVDNQPIDIAVSLSHRNGRAVCALAPTAVELGCDLELIEPHSDAFLTDYFTQDEQELVDNQPESRRQETLAILWSGKESALKALREGLRLDTRCVRVEPESVLFDSDAWSPIRVRYQDSHILHGWWQAADNMVRTLVAVPLPAPPIPLRIASFY
jgi:4'-phosphopantetheinyl transferase